MARIVTNTTSIEDLSTDQEVLWFYNGLDCCVTREIYDVLEEKLSPEGWKGYNFERGMVGPAFLMSRRGVFFNEEERDKAAVPLRLKRIKLNHVWRAVSEAVCGEPVNPASPLKLHKMFYEYLGVPKQYKKEGNKVKLTLDRDALEKIIEKAPRAKVPAKVLIELRDIKKKMDVLYCKRDPDGRFRTSFNVAGTETWRWSSSESNVRTGSNLQNVTKEMRRPFEADPGFKMFYADLDQAESIVTAYTSGDENFIAACHSGDLHTQVCKMIWPDLEWVGDSVEDRKTAEQIHSYSMSYRDMAKRAGHGTNYMLTPFSLARKMGIKQRDAFKFYLSYLGGEIEIKKLDLWHKQDPTGGFDKLIESADVQGGTAFVTGAFSGIRDWHERIAVELETSGKLTTPFGLTRTFWGNPTSASTLREAVAFVPQSTIGCVLHVGLYRVWRELDPDIVQPLANVHDAILGQIREEVFDEYLDKVLECMSNPLKFGEREVTIPTSAECGYNWAPVDPKNKMFKDGNPNGLKDWVRGH